LKLFSIIALIAVLCSTPRSHERGSVKAVETDSAIPHAASLRSGDHAQIARPLCYLLRARS